MNKPSPNPPLNDVFRAAHATQPSRGRPRTKNEQKEPTVSVPENLRNTFTEWCKHANPYWYSVAVLNQITILDIFYWYSRMCDNAINPTTHIHVLSKMDKRLHQEVKIDNLVSQPWYILPKAKMVVPDILRHRAS